MFDENPTGDQSGASITDRLERYLAAEESPADDGHRDEGGDDNDDNGPDANADKDDNPGSDDQGDDQEPHITTADLAKFLGIEESMVDVDNDGNPVIKTKIDGKDGAAKFADVLKSYQLQGHVDNKVREVAEQQKVLQQRIAEANQAATARIEQLEASIAIAHQELLSEFQAVDWATLRAQNPGEYSALYADFQARQNRLGGLAQKAQAERQQQQAKQQEDWSSQLRKEWEDLGPTLLPEWKDAEAARKDNIAITQWGLKAGYQPDELKAMARPLHIATLRKAMLYDQLQESKKAVENKVRTAPKLVKPGQAQSSTREQQNIRNLKDNVRKSGGKDRDVAAFLLANGIV